MPTEPEAALRVLGWTAPVRSGKRSQVVRGRSRTSSLHPLELHWLFQIRKNEDVGNKTNKKEIQITSPGKKVDLAFFQFHFYAFFVFTELTLELLSTRRHDNNFIVRILPIIIFNH